MAISFNNPPVGGSALLASQRDIIRTALELGVALGVADPTTEGVDKPIGSIGYNTDDPVKVYIKTGVLDTDWTEITAINTANLLLTNLTNLVAGSLLSSAELRNTTESVSINATSGTVPVIDFSLAHVFDVTLTDNATFTFSNPPSTGESGSFTLILRQDATGNRIPTWPASVVWAESTEPTVSNAANAVDVLTFFTTNAGTTWYGFLGGVNFG